MFLYKINYYSEGKKIVFLSIKFRIKYKQSNSDKKYFDTLVLDLNID